MSPRNSNNGQVYGKGIYLAVKPGLSMIQCMKTSSNQLILAHINSDEAKAQRQQDDGGAVVVSEKHVYSKSIRSTLSTVEL